MAQIRIFGLFQSILVLCGLFASTAYSASGEQPERSLFNVGVTRDGLYYIGFDELQALDGQLDTSVLPHLKLSLYGKTQPVVPRIDAQGKPEGFWFMGRYPREVEALDVPSATRLENVYQISVAGQDAPPIYFQQTTDNSGTTLHRIDDKYIKLHIEQNNKLEHQRQYPDYPTDRVVWDMFAFPRLKKNLIDLEPMADLLARDHATSLTLSLWGHSNTGNGHDWSVLLNGRKIGETFWKGQAHQNFKATFPSSLLNKNERNIVELVSNKKDPTNIDVIMLESVTLHYRPDADALQPNRLYPVEASDGSQGALFTAKLLMKDSPTYYTYSGNLPESSFGILDATATTRPDRIESLAHRQPLLADATQPFDVVVVTHPDFIETIGRYVAYRESQGQKVLLAGIDRLYNEYNFGNFGPEAIRHLVDDLIAHQLIHDDGSSSLFLVGDATSDYLQINHATRNYVPAHHRRGTEYHLDQWWPAFIYEDYFVNASDADARPVMAVGRFPCNENETLNHYIDKIIEYEASGAPADWKNRALLIASEGFASTKDRFGELVFGGMDVSSIESSLKPVESGKTDTEKVVDAFNRGEAIVYYVGHGSCGVWSNYWRETGQSAAELEFILTPGDVRQMNNKGMYPIVLASSCFTTHFDVMGQFDSRHNEYNNIAVNGLGTYMVEARDSGAIAVLGHNSRVTPSITNNFFITFYGALRDPQCQTVGEAFRRAKAQLKTPPYHGINLIGDPSLRIRNIF